MSIFTEPPVDPIPTEIHAAQLLGRLGRYGPHRIFTVRDLRQHVIRAGWATTTAVREALDLLADLGAVRQFQARDGGGRLRTRYQVTPTGYDTTARIHPAWTTATPTEPAGEPDDGPAPGGDVTAILAELAAVLGPDWTITLSRAL